MVGLHERLACVLVPAIDEGTYSDIEVLRCDEEINVVALDPELVRILDEHFDADLKRSVQITEVRWERRTLRQRAAEHLVTPLRRWF